MADVDAVHDVVEHIDELGRHCGQGQLYHQRSDRGAGQGRLALVRLGQGFLLQSNLRPIPLEEARPIYDVRGQYTTDLRKKEGKSSPS